MLAAALALACLVVPAACAPSGESAADGPVTFRFSTWGNDSRLKITKEAVAAFSKANPEISVSVETSEWGAYTPELVPPPQVTPVNASGFGTEFTTAA